jgi:TrmH family RNA methyltransferase
MEVLKRNRTKRHRYGEFLVEGVRALNSAVQGGWEIRSFAYARGRTLSRWAQTMLDESSAESHFEMTPDLFDALSDKEEPSELLAVVGMKPDDASRITTRDGMTVVVVDRPASPGNLGTIIRSCDAFGVDGVIITGHGVDLYDPATIRASVGTFFTVPCVGLASHDDVAFWVSNVRQAYRGLSMVGTSARGTTPLREHKWGSEVVLLIGNETHGLSHAYRAMCDATLSIPMRGSATSLNAAIATSIVLYELTNRATGCHPERRDGS